MEFKKRTLMLSLMIALSAGALHGCSSDNNNDAPADPTGALGFDYYETDDVIKITGFTAPSSLSDPASSAYGDPTQKADFGSYRDAELNGKTASLFGFTAPVSNPGATSVDRTADVTAAAQMDLASGLSAAYLTREAGNKADMMDFWPAGNSPTHLITCIEGGSEELANGKMNPSVQSIDLSDGTVKTILRGMSRCDGIRTTPWGTVLATEEADDGGAYEIIDPLNTSEHTVLNRATGEVVKADGSTTATNIVKRAALPTMAWEGLTVLESGVVIGGDELRPGSYADTSNSEDTDGGAIFKFVPETLRTDTGNIASLAESPLAAGSVYALQVSCRGAESSSYGQHGQGCEIGHGKWISVSAASARIDADANGATGYYRPEDLHRDPVFADANYPAAVRFCWANTGNDGAANYAEVVCGIDYDPAMTDASIPDSTNNVPEVVVNRFIEGDTMANSFDNLAFQPGTGILYVIEDDNPGDIWACLPDGADRDVKSDGCVHVLRLHTTGSEPTGFIFSPDGTEAYFSVQHSDDPA